MLNIINLRVIAVFFLAALTNPAESAENSAILKDIFSLAVADASKSFTSMTTALMPEWAVAMNLSSLNSSCFGSANNFSALSACLQTHSLKCISFKDLTSLYSIDVGTSLSKQDVSNLSPALIYSLLSCDDKELHEMANSQNKTRIQVNSESTWLYSMLFVTLINLCSLAGAIVLPCMKMKIYKLVLMFMVALAVGTLAGSGLLFLIPEAFMLVHDDNNDYIWKSTTIMGGIYLFYITEKIMRMVNARRENTNIKKKRGEQATEGAITTSFRRIPIDNSLPGKDPAQIVESLSGMCISQPNPHSSLHSSNSSEIVSSSSDRIADKIFDDSDVSIYNISNGDVQPLHQSPDKSVSNGHSYQDHHKHVHHHTEVAPVAYMIIFGDALHNFIDGLSIGSAFTQSVMTGVSVSVAVMCEELPHELGDFAILLNSGMKISRALMYNFLSACTCYLGTIVGIVLGENTASHEWIFAVAGGMFLYISLVDMMPEMNTAAETEEGKEFGEKKTLLLQNCGLLTGYGIMLIFAVFGGNINFEE